MNGMVGDLCGKQMACIIKDALAKHLEVMQDLTNSIDDAVKILPPSDQLKTVEDIYKRTVAEVGALYQTAYTDLDIIIHDGDVLVVTEIPMEEDDE